MLKGVPGKHVRLQMPDTVERALNMAIVATDVETFEREGDRDERASKQKVFTVRGGRGNLQGPSVWRPRNKSQEGKYRVGRGFTSMGQYQGG
jgi:hypothetical protein